MSFYRSTPRSLWPWATHASCSSTRTVGSFSVIVLAGVVLNGCGTAPREPNQPPEAQSVPAPTPQSRAGASAAPADVALHPLSGAVTQAQLVDAAKQLNPTAQAIAAARRAAEARVNQAGVWANPEVEFAYGKTRPQVDGLKADSPYGAQLKQRLEWWGKRQGRVAVAAAQMAVVQAESATAMLELEIDVRLAAIAYASSQAAANQAVTQARLADELASVVAKRQAVGDIDRGEAARITLEATLARVHVDAAHRAVVVQREVLLAWCGAGVTEDLTVSDGLSDELTDPRIAADGSVLPASNAHPRVRAALEAERAAEARIAAEREARMPDVTVGVFGDREFEKDTLGLTLSFEVPLWDRNAAGIAEAEAERAQRAAQRRLAIRALERERVTALGEVRATAATLIALRDQAIPVAAEVSRLRTTAFTAGDASLIEMLEAQRAALTVQRELLDVRQRHAEALVRLLAATGTATGTRTAAAP